MVSPAHPSQLLVALRKSALSLCHAQYIRDRLLAQYPQCEITLRGITTQGDRILEKALADIGGKGLFIEEIENAMRDGRADVAVHSLKDMPMEMAAGFTIAAVPVREDPRDTLVCNKYASIEALPDGAIVGTSSLRREAQLREKNPRLTVRLLRGNVNTRVRKLDEGQYDAMILAAAGLNRLEQNHRISAYLEPEDFLPAVGQGALAIECALDRPDVIAAVAPLMHHPTLSRDHRGAGVLARARGQLPHAHRGLCGVPQRRALAARLACEPRRHRRAARRALGRARCGRRRCRGGRSARPGPGRRVQVARSCAIHLAVRGMSSAM